MKTGFVSSPPGTTEKQDLLKRRINWVPGHCDIKDNEEADRLAQMGSNSHFCGPEPFVPLSASIVRDINREWVIDAHSKHWIALNSCIQSKLYIKPKVANNQIPQESALKNSSKFQFLLSRGIFALINICTRCGTGNKPCLSILSFGRADSTSLCLSVFPTLATLRTRIFGKPIINASASAILRFAFQSGR
jgi:hypothetical protein